MPAPPPRTAARPRHSSWRERRAPILERTHHAQIRSGANIVVGSTLPNAVTVYPLPGTIKVATPDRYNYALINNNPVVIERENRRVIHTWP